MQGLDSMLSAFVHHVNILSFFGVYHQFQNIWIHANTGASGCTQNISNQNVVVWEFPTKQKITVRQKASVRQIWTMMTFTRAMTDTRTQKFIKVTLRNENASAISSLLHFGIKISWVALNSFVRISKICCK